MKAPKCKICGEYHYGLCAVRSISRTSVEERHERETSPRDTVQPIAKKPFDRKAYQREYMLAYMRKSRKALKDKT